MSEVVKVVIAVATPVGVTHTHRAGHMYTDSISNTATTTTTTTTTTTIIATTTTIIATTTTTNIVSAITTTVKEAYQSGHTFLTRRDRRCDHNKEETLRETNKEWRYKFTKSSEQQEATDTAWREPDHKYTVYKAQAGNMD
ncbi:hypothetical protein Pmani_021384 [Petrolisthes manimaculis]|uniref:Uncharacterized protein n=1 Tax=Petrolisthes manimaculis TaxID=1843537 RepID=A0AAE1PGK7_9EUCA|nr:hypothetical protein Pmani_021384 [Petrolisthes manimaculis]